MTLKARGEVYNVLVKHPNIKWGIGKVSEKIIDKIGELKQVKGQLEDTRKATIDAKNELVALKNELADQKKIVDQNPLIWCWREKRGNEG